MAQGVLKSKSLYLLKVGRTFQRSLIFTFALALKTAYSESFRNSNARVTVYNVHTKKPVARVQSLQKYNEPC